MKNIIYISKNIKFGITKFYKEPYIITKNLGSLKEVLNAKLSQDYLLEIKEELEKTKATKEESVKYIKENNLPSYIDRADLYMENSEEVAPMLPWEWGANPYWLCDSYKDITEIYEFYDESGKKEVYKTSEVLEVIDQWIEYLDKFYGEKK